MRLPSLKASPSQLSLSLSADDPEIWDFTLDRIEELDAAAGSPPSRGARPGTPGSHSMQTRSKTPQRGPGRPPGDAAPHSRGGHTNQYRHITGEGS